MLADYGIDLNKFAKWVTSDTTGSARSISTFFENENGEQVDCEMHNLNLILLYAVGKKIGSAYQERVFSNGGIAMTNKQTDMGDDHYFSERLLLRANRRTLWNW